MNGESSIFCRDCQWQPVRQEEFNGVNYKKYSYGFSVIRCTGINGRDLIHLFVIEFQAMPETSIHSKVNIANYACRINARSILCGLVQG